MEYAVKYGGKTAEYAYKKFLELLINSIKEMGKWSAIEVADVEQVMKLIINLKCTIWYKKIQG